MHFFHTFGSTEDELTISIGQSVGNGESAMTYARNAKETECTEENTGSRTQCSVTRVGCVRHVIQGKKGVAERFISQLLRKRRTSQLKKNKAFPTRFKKKNYGRKIKKGGKKGEN